MCDLKKMPANSIVDPAMTVTRNFSQNWGYKGGAHRESFRLRNLREFIVVDSSRDEKINARGMACRVGAAVWRLVGIINV